MAVVDGSSTVDEARVFVDEHARKGVRCPCCSSFVKVYKRKLNSGMAMVLVSMFMSKTEWIDMSVLVTGQPRFSGMEYSKLRFWNLIEEDEIGKGKWRLTDLGRSFVEAGLRVPSHVYVMHNQVVSVDEDLVDTVSIREALGSHFDLDELLSA